MVSAPKVVEDGVEASSPSRGPSRWTWLVAGLLVGVGATALVRGGDQTAATTTSVPTSVPATASGQPVVEGTSETIAGFGDSLVGAKRSDGQSLELAIWPVSGELYHRSVTVGSSMPPAPVAFDTSGRMLATVIPAPGGEGWVLYGGVPDTASIVAVGVTGYAWHDSAPAALAYTTEEAGELLLWTTTGNLAESVLTARAVGIEGGVVAWGDWGFAVQDEDSIVLFTDSGEIKDTHPGRVLASYATGWLAVESDEIILLSSGGGVRGLEREGLRGPYTVGEFSRNGEYLALLDRDGVSIVTVDSDTGLVESGLRPGVPQVIWSSDNRFVLYPGLRGIVVVDTTDFTSEEVLASDTFTGLGVVPMAGS